MRESGTGSQPLQAVPLFSAEWKSSPSWKSQPSRSASSLPTVLVAAQLHPSNRGTPVMKMQPVYTSRTRWRTYLALLSSTQPLHLQDTSLCKPIIPYHNSLCKSISQTPDFAFARHRLQTIHVVVAIKMKTILLHHLRLACVYGLRV